MKDELKRFVIKFSILEKMMHAFFQFKGKNDAAIESKKRKSLSIFDYQALSQPIAYSPEESIIDNNLYGYAHQIKKFAGVTRKLKGYMEHGLYWGGMVHKDEIHWHYSSIITLSEKRKLDIEKKLPNKTAIPIGPYIHYANSILSSKEQSKLKQKLGKVLLVFPSHSVKNVDKKYDYKSFIEEINKRKKDYDTVLVSLYFIDALDPSKVKVYEDEGFKVVTSGHKFDFNFVARQKTIIELADMTMSNAIGTHIGYCIFLKKPHYVFNQELKLVAINETEQKRIDSVSEPEDYAVELQQKEIFTNLFSNFNPIEISKEQQDLCSEYWGFQELKSKEELSIIFC